MGMETPLWECWRTWVPFPGCDGGGSLLILSWQGTGVEVLGFLNCSGRSHAVICHMMAFESVTDCLYDGPLDYNRAEPCLLPTDAVAIVTPQGQGSEGLLEVVLKGRAVGAGTRACRWRRGERKRNCRRRKRRTRREILPEGLSRSSCPSTSLKTWTPKHKKVFVNREGCFGRNVCS